MSRIDLRSVSRIVQTEPIPIMNRQPQMIRIKLLKWIATPLILTQSWIHDGNFSLPQRENYQVFEDQTVRSLFPEWIPGIHNLNHRALLKPLGKERVKMLLKNWSFEELYSSIINSYSWVLKMINEALFVICRIYTRSTIWLRLSQKVSTGSQRMHNNTLQKYNLKPKVFI